jgi:hypothetical protein
MKKQKKEKAVNKSTKTTIDKSKREMREERFPYEYMIDMNSTKAAIRCGCSERSARTLGARLFAKDNIQRKIKELQEQTNQRALMDANEVERLLDICIRANPKKYANEIGITKGLHELTEDEAFAIDSIDTWEKETKDGGLLGGTSLKLLNKAQLFNLKMKRLGMLKEVHEVVTEPYADRIKRLRGKKS